MNRAELQNLSEERVRDAEALLAAACWSGAYYLVGYAVECALKACIARSTNQHDFPDKNFAQDVFTHDLRLLMKLAGLETQLSQDVASGGFPELGANWLVTKDRTETARYQVRSEPQARDLHSAVTSPNDGVLPWIRRRW